MPDTPTTWRDALTETERDLIDNANAGLAAAVGAETSYQRQAAALLEALEELGQHRVNAARGIEPPAGDGPRLPEVRGRIRLLLDRLSRTVIDTDGDTVPLGERLYEDVHALAAACASYTRLGGDLELGLAMPNTDALEAEARVAELEQAIDYLVGAARELGPQRELLVEGALEPLGRAIERLVYARA